MGAIIPLLSAEGTNVPISSDFKLILEGTIPAGFPDAKICVDNITSYTEPCSALEPASSNFNWFRQFSITFVAALIIGLTIPILILILLIWICRRKHHSLRRGYTNNKLFSTNLWYYIGGKDMCNDSNEFGNSSSILRAAKSYDPSLSGTTLLNGQGSSLGGAGDTMDLPDVVVPGGRVVQFNYSANTMGPSATMRPVHQQGGMNDFSTFNRHAMMTGPGSPQVAGGQGNTMGCVVSGGQQNQMQPVMMMTMKPDGSLPQNDMGHAYQTTQQGPMIMSQSMNPNYPVTTGHLNTQNNDQTGMFNTCITGVGAQQLQQQQFQPQMQPNINHQQQQHLQLVQPTQQQQQQQAFPNQTGIVTGALTQPPQVQQQQVVVPQQHQQQLMQPSTQQQTQQTIQPQQFIQSVSPTVQQQQQPQPALPPMMLPPPPSVSTPQPTVTPQSLTNGLPHPPNQQSQLSQQQQRACQPVQPTQYYAQNGAANNNRLSMVNPSVGNTNVTFSTSAVASPVSNSSSPPNNYQPIAAVSPTARMPTTATPTPISSLHTNSLTDADQQAAMAALLAATSDFDTLRDCSQSNNNNNSNNNMIVTNGAPMNGGGMMTDNCSDNRRQSAAIRADHPPPGYDEAIGCVVVSGPITNGSANLVYTQNNVGKLAMQMPNQTATSPPPALPPRRILNGVEVEEQQTTACLTLAERYGLPVAEI